jgi:type II restriction/modification system DNA methylase subunit YeeA
VNRLPENANSAFQGPVKVGPFNIPSSLAQTMLVAANPDGRPNTEVVRPWVNGSDPTGRPREMWIIDFGEMTEAEAALYEMPFEFVKELVKPLRATNRRARRREFWWQHGETVPGLRAALTGLRRFLVTPRVSKHRVFVWVPAETLPDSAVVAIARDDDYSFGVLQSHVHELWARGLGTQLREVESGFRYTPTTTFETFKFPDPTDELREEIAAAGESLAVLREGWLNPSTSADGNLRSRTLTNLYNRRPSWLQNAHDRVDQAVHAAYGWEYPLEPEEVLARLVELNLGRAAEEMSADLIAPVAPSHSKERQTSLGRAR